MISSLNQTCPLPHRPVGFAIRRYIRNPTFTVELASDGFVSKNGWFSDMQERTGRSGCGPKVGSGGKGRRKAKWRAGRDSNYHFILEVPRADRVRFQE